MLFMITGDESSISIWHQAILDAMKFRDILKSYYVFNPKKEIRTEISKIISDMGCEAYCELFDRDNFECLDPDFLIYSVSEENSFYEFCIKCKNDFKYSCAMKIGSLSIGSDGFEHKNFNNRFFYEVISLFCIINAIIMYFIFRN